MIKSLNTIRRGIASQNGASSCLLNKKKNFEGYPCLTMPAKISWFFQPIPVFVNNLAQNSTRFSLSNEPFLLINHVFSFFCVHANNILSTPLYLQNHYAKNLWACFSFFPKQQAWPYVFTRIFGKSKFSTKNRNHVGVCSNKQVLEIQVIPLRGNHAPRKPKKKHTMKWPQKRSFICMNNEKSLCILAWK